MASSLRLNALRAGRQAPAVVRISPAFVAARSSQKHVLAFERLIASVASPNGTVSTSEYAPVVKTAKPMSIVFVATEVSPWSKTGGLGDVVGSLPMELAKRGHKVMTISPRCEIPEWSTINLAVLWS